MKFGYTQKPSTGTGKLVRLNGKLVRVNRKMDGAKNRAFLKKFIYVLEDPYKLKIGLLQSY